MVPQIILLLLLAAIAWLFSCDRKRAAKCSWALWIPLLWLLILGSRPISVWLSGNQPTDPLSYQEGSPLDRNIFLGLILAGIAVLIRRRLPWRRLVTSNRWLIAYFAYLGISVLWSDFSFIAFKRWFKDFGSIVMALVVLTEVDPVCALQLVLIRCAYVLVPSSVVLIKYFPEIGRYYNAYVWTYSYGGVTTDKNTLGMTLFVCGMGILWGILELWKQRPKFSKAMFAHLLLMGMCLWLWKISRCATSLACTALASGIFCAMRIPKIRNGIRRIGFQGLAGLALILITLNAILNPLELLTGALGRDVTLTGRTDIWRQVLSVDNDPLLGAGYSSFWKPERAEGLSKELGILNPLKEAHNGYLEIYLNTGIAGLTLLAVVLLGGARRLFKGLDRGDTYGEFRFAVLIAALAYNVAESTFSGLVIMWALLLLVLIEIPQRSRAFQPRTKELQKQ